ncbi:TPA: ATP-binding protein [Enterobacter hormaechei subsp. steigerwaltii]|nr:ATP-binding protein [Enterobacter hormaechei subsp. steigerwaltii]
MTLWPRTLLSRLLIIVLLGLLLANALSLTLVMVERMRSARTIMLGNLENDVATSVAILDRLPAKERPEWLERLSRGKAAHAFNEMQSRIQTYLRERAQILASISHDLQTPITRMKLRIEMADQPELRDKLLSDLDNMSRLVREGIAYARSSESLEETMLKLELNAWVNSIASDYQDIGKNVQFHARNARLPIVTRPQALRRVMTNLLDNALKFGESAVIEIDENERQVAIRIMDNGPGIPEAELEAVLQPFYRVETSRNRETGGTGLGLAIAAQLTAQLDGKLHLANRAEGGLAVSVILPRG